MLDYLNRMSTALKIVVIVSSATVLDFGCSFRRQYLALKL